MNIDRLLKLLRLTTSPNDHEALLAIRTANRMIAQEGTTWADLFEPDEQMDLKPHESAPPWQDDPDWPAKVIAFVRDNAWDDFNFKFIDDIDLKLKRGVVLSVRQTAALINVYETVKRFKEGHG